MQRNYSISLMIDFSQLLYVTYGKKISLFDTETVLFAVNYFILLPKNSLMHAFLLAVVV